MDALSEEIMEVKIKFHQLDIAKWFGHNKLEVIYVVDNTAKYGDVIHTLITRYQKVRDFDFKQAEADFYDHFLITSKGRIVRRILDEPIDEKEVTVWYFFDV
ncbi:MAG: hypothetical protein NWE83_10930 [Candidatus Bathyarchaeota archaeon]|nr:hypothetical protein [Candidatus Bathyarchaeota archaeon]